MLHPEIYTLREGRPTPEHCGMWKLMPGEFYLLCWQDKTIIGLINYTILSYTVWNAHINMLPEYRGHIAKDCAKQFLRNLHNNTPVKTVLTQVPTPCKHAKVFTKSIGFKEVGIIPNSHYYGNKLTDLHILGVQI